MANVHEAFRLSRQAKNQRRIWGFYTEHNLFDEALLARTEMLAFLRAAGQQWRLALAATS